jgi:rsbT co-antagonist protein RsbR
MDDSLELLAEKYKKIFFLTDDDVINIRQAGEAIKYQIDAAYSELYAWMEMSADLQHIFTDQVVDAIVRQEKETWLDFTAGNISAEYVMRQRQATRDLQRLGVPFEAYLSYLVTLHDIIEKIYARHNLGTFDLVRSFKKMAGISICIVIDTYNEIANETIKAQNNALMEMSTPVTKLWDGILFLPLVGIIDSRRAQDVMTAMLQKITETSSRVFILDISGIAVLDTAVANYLIKITKATTLMGCKCIISGISGAVAQTIVELGIHTDEIMTTGNMQDALEKAFKRAKIKISSKDK